MKNPTSRLLLVAVLSAMVGLATACTATQGPSMQTVRVTARDLAFAPDEVALRAGSLVRLTLANEGVLEHDITGPGLSVGEAVAPSHGTGEHAMVSTPPGTVHLVAAAGTSATVEFMPQKGAFEFYCAVPGHREAGMRGTIRVM